MPKTIPPIKEVREHLATLGGPALRELASTTGVPLNTLSKIRSGYTPNPGIETVRKFYGALKTTRKILAGKSAQKARAR